MNIIGYIVLMAVNTGNDSTCPGQSLTSMGASDQLRDRRPEYMGAVIICA